MNRPLRKHHFANRPFAQEGTTLDADDWLERKDQLLAELLEDLPALTQLQASAPDVRYVVNSEGVTIQFILIETPQLALEFADDDLFRLDVRLIQSELETLHEAYIHALKSSDDPQSVPGMVTKRRRMLKAKKTGFIDLTSAADTADSIRLLPSPPKIIGQAVVTTLTGKVVRIERTTLRLRLTQNLLATGTYQHELHTGQVLTIHRGPSLTGVEASPRLVLAMDNETTLSLSVIIEINWIDGLPGKISGTGFKDAQDHVHLTP